MVTFNQRFAAFLTAVLASTPPLVTGRPNRRRLPKHKGGEAWLHPTKGWRGDGTYPRGTNKRRIKT